MKSARLFVVFLLVVVSGAGCAVNIKTNVRAQGEKLSVPIGGLAVIRGDVVDITIATERDFYFLQKGARHDANPTLDKNICNKVSGEKPVENLPADEQPIQPASDPTGPAGEEMAGVPEGPAERAADPLPTAGGGSAPDEK